MRGSIIQGLTAEHFRELCLFEPLNDDEIHEVLKLGTIEEHEAHSNILIEGEQSWGLYLLIEGMVGVYKNNRLTQSTYDVGRLRAGSFFGEMSLIDDLPRSATVKALTDCTLFYISKEAFQKLLCRSDDTRARFYESCVRNLVASLRELDENYVVSQHQLWTLGLKNKSNKAVA